MTDSIQRLLDLLDGVQQKASVDAVFGEPVTAEGRTVIPVAEVAYGLGAGLGVAGEEGAPSGGGSGGGIRARPLGVVEITADGVRVQPVVDEQKITLAAVLLTAWIVAWIAGTLALIFGRGKDQQES